MRPRVRRRPEVRARIDVGHAQQQSLEVAALRVRQRLRMVESRSETREQLTFAAGVGRGRGDRVVKSLGVDVLRTAEGHDQRVALRVAERLQVDVFVSGEGAVVLWATAGE